MYFEYICWKFAVHHYSTIIDVRFLLLLLGLRKVHELVLCAVLINANFSHCVNPGDHDLNICSAVVRFSCLDQRPTFVPGKAFLKELQTAISP